MSQLRLSQKRSMGCDAMLVRFAIQMIPCVATVQSRREGPLCLDDFFVKVRVTFLSLGSGLLGMTVF